KTLHTARFNCSAATGGRRRRRPRVKNGPEVDGRNTSEDPPVPDGIGAAPKTSREAQSCRARSPSHLTVVYGFTTELSGCSGASGLSGARGLMDPGDQRRHDTGAQRKPIPPFAS